MARAETSPEPPLGDRRVERVTLDEIDAHAMERAPAITEAAERVGLADAQMEGARIALPDNPTLEGGIANKFSGGYGLRKFEVGVSQSIEIAGQRATRINSAERYREALRAQVEAARWEVHQQLHVLFYRTLVAERRVELRREVAELADKLERTTEQRKSAGEVGLVDLQVARAEAAKAHESLVESRSKLEDLSLRMAEVSGWTNEPLPLPIGELPEVRTVPTADQLLERALDHEPTLAAIEAERERAEAELREAERAVWPNPTIGLAFEEEQRLGPDKEQSLWVRLGFPLPIWQRNQTRKATARTRADIAERRLVNRRQKLRTRIRRQVRDVNRAAERANIFGEDVIPRFEEQSALLEKGFELGEMSMLDVYNARDRLLKVQRRALAAIGDYVGALGALERSLGTEIWNDSAPATLRRR
jgi:cobalt-zinc-cadmium efflux system outer membrane protein